MGRIVGLYVTEAAGAAMTSCQHVQLIPGVGILGDRYATGRGFWSEPQWADQELTLVEEELALEMGIEAGLLRRNLVTRGVRLDELIGATFNVGAAVVRGVRRCDPCQHLEELTHRPGLAQVIGARGGLRAHIVSGGEVQLGDTVRLVPTG